jgi:hypothetical protein
LYGSPEAIISKLEIHFEHSRISGVGRSPPVRAAVFYQDSRLLGGGWIAETISAKAEADLVAA